MPPCILAGFMKQMQCNALIIKTAPKQVWLYFIYRTMLPGIHSYYHEASYCFEDPKKSFPTQKNPGIENFKHLEITGAPPE